MCPWWAYFLRNPLGTSYLCLPALYIKQGDAGGSESLLANSHIHGLGAEDLARGPVFAEIAATLAGQLEGIRVIAHNAGFDSRFLDAEYARLNMAFCTDLQFSWIDSLQIARQLVPTPHNLASLCTRFKIANPLPHAALGGAISAVGCAPSTPHAGGATVGHYCRLPDRPL